jgi:putative FmdB family regulatory protein
MPLYEFKCDNCGLFDQWRVLSEYDTPAHCPTCQQTARRVFSPPAVLSGSLRLKHENREPQVVKRDREPVSPRVSNHTGSRPWMIGH